MTIDHRNNVLVTQERGRRGKEESGGTKDEAEGLIS